MESDDAPPVRPIGFNGEAPPVVPLSEKTPGRLYGRPPVAGASAPSGSAFGIFTALFVLCAVAGGVTAAVLLARPTPICGNRQRVRK